MVIHAVTLMKYVRQCHAERLSNLSRRCFVTFSVEPILYNTELIQRENSAKLENAKFQHAAKGSLQDLSTA